MPLESTYILVMKVSGSNQNSTSSESDSDGLITEDEAKTKSESNTLTLFVDKLTKAELRLSENFDSYEKSSSPAALVDVTAVY